MKIKFDMETCVNEIYDFKENDQEYKEVLERFKNVLKNNDKLDIKERIDIDDTVTSLETVVSDVVYKKAFHDGMKFILNTLAGEEVIEL